MSSSPGIPSNDKPRPPARTRSRSCTLLLSLAQEIQDLIFGFLVGRQDPYVLRDTTIHPTDPPMLSAFGISPETLATDFNHPDIICEITKAILTRTNIFVWGCNIGPRFLQCLDFISGPSLYGRTSNNTVMPRLGQKIRFLEVCYTPQQLTYEAAVHQVPSIFRLPNLKELRFSITTIPDGSAHTDVPVWGQIVALDSFDQTKLQYFMYHLAKCRHTSTTTLAASLVIDQPATWGRQAPQISIPLATIVGYCQSLPGSRERSAWSAELTAGRPEDWLQEDAEGTIRINNPPIAYWHACVAAGQRLEREKRERDSIAWTRDHPNRE